MGPKFSKQLPSLPNGFFRESGKMSKNVRNSWPPGPAGNPELSFWWGIRKKKSKKSEISRISGPEKLSWVLHAKIDFQKVRTRPGLMCHLRSLTAVYSFFSCQAGRWVRGPSECQNLPDFWGAPRESRISGKSGIFGKFTKFYEISRNSDISGMSPESSKSGISGKSWDVRSPNRRC